MCGLSSKMPIFLVLKSKRNKNKGLKAIMGESTAQGTRKMNLAHWDHVLSDPGTGPLCLLLGIMKSGLFALKGARGLRRYTQTPK